MRIFQVIESSTNISLKANRTWYRNLHEPLVDMGCDVFLFPAEDGRRAMQENDASLRASFSSDMLDTFRREHARKPFDLAFFYLMDGMFDPAVVDEIRRQSVITTNFSCNNIHQFYLVENISKHFDVNLYAEKDAKAKFDAIGVNSLWWPMASNPKYFRPLNVPRTIDISFVGGNYALRSRYIYHLLESGLDVHAYGPGWDEIGQNYLRAKAKRAYYALKALASLSFEERSNASAELAEYDFRLLMAKKYPKNVHIPVTDDELIALYSKSHISLGFLEVFDGHKITSKVKKHLHLREFEAAISGALYFTGYTDELAELFEIDKEVVVYRDYDELLSKSFYFLAHPSDANKVRQAGLARALRDHTYHIRYEQLFAALGLSKRGK